MSASIKTIVVRDSRLPGEKSDVATLMVPEGPASVTYQSVSTPDPTSTNPTFTIDNPSHLSGLQRTAYWEMTGTFVISGTVLGDMMVADRIALRQFPLQSMCSSVEAQINNTTVSIGAISQILPALLRVGNPSESGSGVQSGTAASPDMTSNYEAAVGRLNSPFRPVGDMEFSKDISPPRTLGITGITLDSPAQITVTFKVREPIILPPFGYTNAAREKAIYGVNQIQIKAIMQNYHRGLSLAIPATSTVTGVTMTPSQQAILAVFVTPDNRSLAIARKEAQTFRYDYSTIQPFFSTLTGAAVPDATSISGSSNSFQLPVIPEKILIFATYSESDRTNQTASYADAFMPITQLQVQAGTQSGIFSGASQMDLYAMSLKNGGATPYYNFAGLPQISSSNAGNQANGSGGPLVIDVAADLHLPDGMTPGMQAQWQFAVSQITCENRYGRAVTGPRLVIVAITGGIIENTGGDSRVIIGGVSTLDADSLKAAPRLSSIEFHQKSGDAGFGGSKIGDWFKKAGKVALSGLEEVGKTALQMAPQLLAMAAGPARGRGSVGGGVVGGGVVGGARAPRALLYR